MDIIVDKCLGSRDGYNYKMIYTKPDGSYCIMSANGELTKIIQVSHN